MSKLRVLTIAAVLVGVAAAVALAQAPASSAKSDHVAAVKQSLQQSMTSLKQYEWVETTTISVKGEERSRRQKACFYNAEGKLEKTTVGGEKPEEGKKKGGKGPAAETIKEAIGLVKQYVPPDAARLQAATDDGRLTVTPADSQGIVRLAIKDYLQTGDTVTLEVDAASDKLTSLRISTFTENPKEAVGMKVTYSAMTDGTLYPAKTKLTVAAQEIDVTMENTLYKKRGK